MADDRPADKPTSLTEPEAPRSAIGRREFLTAGALGTAGLVIRPHAAGADEIEKAGDDALLLFASDPRFEDRAFNDRAAAVCPRKIPNPLPDRDWEECQAASSLLWSAFGRGCAPLTSCIEPRAVEEGINYSRGYILKEIQDGGGLGGFPFTTYVPKWVELGREASLAMGASKCITPANFVTAWKKVYNTPPEPFAFPNPVDEAAEMVGSHMWVMFGVGVAKAPVSAKTYDILIALAGRLRSRYYVRNNIISRKVVVGTGPPDYSKWDFSGVGLCADLVGVRAAKNATSHSAISEKNFDNAWCQISDSARTFAYRMGMGHGPLGGGCG